MIHKRISKIPIKLYEVRTDTQLGCVMIGLDPIGQKWDDIIAQVDDNDVYKDGDNYGKETELHITLLYGIHLDDGVRKSILDHYKSNFNVPKITGVSVSLFEKEEYDVLKYDIELTPELTALNEYLTSNYEFTTSYPDYHPHCTIAYLKKGTGQKYVDSFAVPQDFMIKNYLWSEDKFKWTLSNTILGPMIVCRDRETEQLQMFDDESYEISQKIGESVKIRRISFLPKI